MFIFGGVFAFVHFMETSSDTARRRLCRFAAFVTGVAIAIWSVASIALQINRGKFEAFVQTKIADSGGGSFGYFNEWLHGRMIKFVNDLLLWSFQQILPMGLLLVALGGLWWTTSNSPKRKCLGSLLIACVVVLEVTLFASRWVTWTSPMQCPAYALTPEVLALQKEVRNQSRVVIVMADAGRHMAVTPFALNTLGPYGIATIQGYDSIVPNGMSQVADKTTAAGILGRLAVSHLISYQGNAPHGYGWKKIWEATQ